MKCHPCLNLALNFLFSSKPPINGILIPQSILMSSSQLPLLLTHLCLLQTGSFAVIRKVFVEVVLSTMTLFTLSSTPIKTSQIINIQSNPKINRTQCTIFHEESKVLNPHVSLSSQCLFAPRPHTLNYFTTYPSYLLILIHHFVLRVQDSTSLAQE